MYLPNSFRKTEIEGLHNFIQENNFAVGRVLEAAGPGQILIIDMGGVEISTFGGLAAMAAVARGINGVVVDGGVRDLSDIRKSGLWLGSRHVTPVSGKRRVRVEGINLPVECGGVKIRPGDYIIADETAIVAVPSEKLLDLLEMAEDLNSRDSHFEEALKSGQSFSQAAITLEHM